MQFLETLRTALREECRLPEGARVVVALSGGADSVALLLGMRLLGYDAEAAHCNFHLRGEESLRDERFVVALCHRHATRLHRRDFDTTDYARSKGISIEMAARELRYAWFETLAKERKADAIAVAHHREDNVETMLLNLARGTGLRGLTGMVPRHEQVIRPLLNVTRTCIEDFLRTVGETFVTDSSNRETVYKRNKVRLEILPLLRQLNPDADRVLADTQRRLAEAECLYDYALDRLRNEVSHAKNGGTDIDIAALHHCPAPRTLFYELLRPYGFSPRRAEEIFAALDGRSGTYYETHLYAATLNRGQFEVRRRRPPLKETEVALPGHFTLPDGRLMRLRVVEHTPDSPLPRDRQTASLSLSSLSLPLTLRSVRPADRFAPLGLPHGTKLVSDFMTDRKRSVLDKRAALVLCDRNGIVWLVGEQPDRRCAVTAATRQVLRIEITEETG